MNVCILRCGDGVGVWWGKHGDDAVDEGGLEQRDGTVSMGTGNGQAYTEGGIPEVGDGP